MLPFRFSLHPLLHQWGGPRTVRCELSEEAGSCSQTESSSKAKLASNLRASGGMLLSLLSGNKPADRWTDTDVIKCVCAAHYSVVFPCKNTFRCKSTTLFLTEPLFIWQINQPLPPLIHKMNQATYARYRLASTTRQLFKKTSSKCFKTL